MLILSVWNTRHSEFIAKRRLSITNLSSENNLPMFQLNAPVFLFINPFTLMIFSRNIGKLFSELKLVTDNLLFIYAAANWEATEGFISFECIHSVIGCWKSVQSWLDVNGRSAEPIPHRNKNLTTQVLFIKLELQNFVYNLTVSNFGSLTACTCSVCISLQEHQRTRAPNYISG